MMPWISMRGALIGLLCTLGLAWAAPASAAKSVGVAPFEQSGTGNGPDVATLLADRLITAGVQCVGPDALGIPAVAEPEPSKVLTWSEGTGVDAIVFGRVTGIGTRFSVDVQLRSTETGEVMSVHVAEIAGPGQEDAAVAELTRKVLEGLTGTTPAPARPRTTASAGSAPAVAARPPAKPKAKRNDAGLFGSGGAPLRITSDDLEARQVDGARRMVFTENVKATRGDLVLTSRRLDAFYPKGSSRPDKIIATGKVVMDRDGGEAHCDKMTYVQAENRIHCEGDAVLVREGDRAKGDKIEWDLTTDTIFIKGNADVLLIDEEDGSGS